MITEAQLHGIMPHLDAGTAARYLPLLNAAMQEFGIDAPLRIAAFLAQVAHESNEFRWMKELASGDEYEGRHDLGNVIPGDGRRYKGRGPIQLTGRTNYRRAGAALGLDLENHPELAETPEVAFRTAGWFWKEHGLNELADRQAFETITRRINGGLNGQPQRLLYYGRAKSTLGIQ